MTPDEFLAAQVRTRLAPAGRATAGAWRELVDGMRRPDAAREAGCSVQAVAAAVKAIARAMARCPTCGAKLRRTK